MECKLDLSKKEKINISKRPVKVEVQEYGVL